MHASAIGRYAVLRKLGHGAMGIVYACYDAQLERRVAVKLLRTDRRSPRVRSRMVREARAMARLSHPNVAQVYEVGETQGRLFVAMEYVHGKTLRAWSRSRRHGWRDIVAIGIAAARGLAAAHAEGLTHRDFKPDNVMIGDDGRVRVMDFGLVRFEDQTTLEQADGAPGDDTNPMTLTRHGTVLGTPVYMAPEQLHDPESGAATDQFAFCVTLWELLFGVRPFRGPDLETLAADHRRARPARGDGRGPAVPRWLRRVLERGLSYAPGDRHPSMAALIGALERGPGEARLRIVATAAMLASMAGLAYLGVATLDRDLRTQRCHDDADAWVAPVDAPAQENALAELHEREAPSAPGTADAAAPWLAAQAAALRVASTEACMRAEVEHTMTVDQHERATWCLDERRTELAAMLDAFAEADDDLVVGVVGEASSLEPVARCLDDDTLARLVIPPPEQREDVRALAVELAREGVALQSRPDDRVVRLRAIADAVDATGWDALRGRLRLIHGRALWFDGDIAGAERMLTDAYFIAAASRDWDTAARAAISQIELVGRTLRRRDDGLAWARHAEVAVGKTADRLGLREAQRLVAIATIHQAEGESTLAREHIERAVAIEEPLLGEEHPVLAERLDQLGVIARTDGDYDTMIAACSRALAMRESLYGPSHRATMWSLMHLGMALQETGANEDARTLYERAIAIAARIERPDSPMLALLHSNLGTCASAAGDHERARVRFEQAIFVKEKLLGSEHPDVGATRAKFGEALLAAGDIDGARAQFERALAIHEAALGPDHVDVAHQLQSLASAHAAAGEHATAEQLHARAVSIVVAADGAGSTEHAYALESHLADLRAAGELERARELARTVVAMHERNLGPEHPTTAFMLAYLGAIELEAGDADAAREHLERAVTSFADRAVYLDAEHDARFALARALVLTGGDRERARALAVRARNGYRETSPERTEVDAWLEANP